MHTCSWGATGATKGSSCPESPKANDVEDGKLFHSVVFSYRALVIVSDYKKHLREPRIEQRAKGRCCQVLLKHRLHHAWHGASNYTKVGICALGVVGAAERRHGHYQAEMAGICCFISYSYNTWFYIIYIATLTLGILQSRFKIKSIMIYCIYIEDIMQKCNLFKTFVNEHEGFMIALCLANYFALTIYFVVKND